MDSRMDATCPLGEPAIGAGMGASTVLPLGTTPTSDTFVVESVKPNVGFLKRGVQPPSNVYIETSDQLIVGVATSAIGEVLTVSYRILRYDGIVIHGQFTISPPSTRTVTIHAEPLTEGFLLSMSCKAAVATTRGQTFVRAFLTKPSLGAGQPSYMLMADYVTTAMAPAFPNGRNITPVEGPGNPRSISVTPPAAGADWLLRVPVNARWKVRALTATLSASAAVANRFPSFALSSAGNTVSDSGTLVALTANQSVIYNGMAIPSPATRPTFFDILSIPPDLSLLANDLIQSNTVAIQAFDQWTGISVAVEEWLDNV
jgi:hypothetical protein